MYCIDLKKMEMCGLLEGVILYICSYRIITGQEEQPPHHNPNDLARNQKKKVMKTHLPLDERQINKHCLSVHLWLYISLLGLCRFFGFLMYTQTVGLLGRGISTSQGLYLNTEQHKHRRNARKYPWLKWVPNPYFQRLNGRRQFMP
jgi:hypothetical protein